MIALRIDFQGEQFQAVFGSQSSRRLTHVVEQVLQQARLVHDEVRELRQAVLGVLNATGAHDPGTVLLRRAPESGLVHPIGFSDELCAHAKGLEAMRLEQGLPARGEAAALRRRFALTMDGEAITNGDERGAVEQDHRRVAHHATLTVSRRAGGVGAGPPGCLPENAWTPLVSRASKRRSARTPGGG